MRTAEQAEKLWALLAAHVYVWRAAPDLPAPALRDLHRMLAPRRPAALPVFEIWSGAIASAHGTLRAIHCRYPGAEPRQLPLVYGLYGKPALAPTSAIDTGKKPGNAGHRVRPVDDKKEERWTGN